MAVHTSDGGPLLRRHPDDATLVELLVAAAAGERGLLCHDADGRASFRSYGQLLQEAGRWLGGLQALGVRAGDRVILQVTDALALWTALWACFLGGVVPVVVAVEAGHDPQHPTVKKLLDAWERLGRPWVVADDGLVAAVAGLADGLRVAGLGEVGGGAPGAAHRAAADDVALMLLTSGSTGQAKIVALTHRNLLSMTAGTIQMNRFGAQDVTLNWMPLDHVGALVFLGIMAVDLGCTQVHVPTDLLLRQPLRWLELIDRHRASISWAPNFAFSLINNQAQALAQRSFDLSSMRFLVNAGEQVGRATARRFLTLLQAHGLPPDALRPAFGMSETCSGITWSAGLTLELLEQEHEHGALPLGRPIPGASARVVDDDGDALPAGAVGRVQLRGPSVTPGYFADPERNREVFAADGWFTTGDLGCLRDGELVITGRKKQEIIVHGVNHAAHEIEGLIEEIDGVRTAHTAAFAVRDPAREVEVLAVVLSPLADDETQWPALVRRVRGHLARRLGLVPGHIVPVRAHEVPKTSIGKIQRELLRERLERGDFADRLAAIAADAAADAGLRGPLSTTEQRLSRIWSEVLGVARVGRDDNFFELGGQSLLLVQTQALLEAAFGRPIAITELFAHSTVAALARHLDGAGDGADDDAAARAGQRRAEARATHAARPADIAVIGMACRFPGADDPESFWDNLRRGVESLTRLDDAALLAAGVDPGLVAHPAFVKVRPLIREADGFDAEFFGYSAREAELMDPQQRVFLECCWTCLEHAGHGAPGRNPAIGVFAGASTNTYVLNHWAPNRGALSPEEAGSVVTLDAMGGFQMMLANDKDYLTTRASYKLDLRGPSVNVQTACSTGLVAVHMAAQSLRSGECDMALCGGASVNAPQETGYLYQEGMIVAQDGHCRAFDARASGTVFGSGVGVVLLKRHADALRDGDTIYAVIRGSAVNNDGGDKLGYLAPGGRGQAAVVAEALAMAGVDAGTIGLVEAHGTATPMGDPVEVEALTRAFRAHTDRARFCALGSVKTNVGHLQIASGIAGFMKAVLALHHREIPPTLHFERPNPRIDFERGPFFVNTELLPWDPPLDGGPRRAGVHSLGMGGANAHVVLEEAAAPEPRPDPPGPAAHVLTLAARSPQALARRAAQLAAYLQAHPELPLADLCFTANTGRAQFTHRTAVVAATRAELAAALAAGPGAPGVWTGAPTEAPALAFLFTGQGSQYAGMARGLYAARPEFRALLDQGDAIHRARTGEPLLPCILGDDPRLQHTSHAQPALFLLEVALARLWSGWGVAPRAVLGHSLGGYAAACFAGVFTLEEGLDLVITRARLMGSLPEGGAMAAVFAPVAELAPLIAGPALAIAAINGPEHTVVSGDRAAVDALCATLQARGVRSKPLRVSHAFHSPRMRPMLADFAAALRRIDFQAPRLPVVSDLTGLPADESLQTPDYWLRHALEPVRFQQGVETLLRAETSVFVEVGPEPTLLAMCREALPPAALGVASLRRGHDDMTVLLRGLAESYVRGVAVDWAAVDAPYPRRRVALPTYPFERRRFTLPLPRGAATAGPRAAAAASPVRAHLERGDRDGLLALLRSHGAGLSPGDADALPRVVDLLLRLDARAGVAPSWPGWLHRVRWIPAAGRLAPAQLVAAAAGAGATALDAGLADLDLERLSAAQQQLEPISAAFVAAALRALLPDVQPGARVDEDALVDRAGVLPRHRRLLTCMLAMLAEDGLLRRDGAGYRVVHSPGGGDPRARLDALAAATPELAVELGLLRRCGAALAQVLVGEVEPLELLFAAGAQPSALTFYRDSRLARVMTAGVRAAVQAALSGRPPGRPLRVLEIGAGTGSTTTAVLPLLPASARYVFTDVSPVFLEQARFGPGADARVELRLLDIERDPDEQGLRGETFDLILATNVLHATADLRAHTLPHVRRLLAADGLLILQEATAAARWFHLIFGLTPGWWRFTDTALRPEHPLLRPDQWEALLAASGFSTPRAVGRDDARPLLRQSLIVAAAGTERPQRLALVADAGGVAEALARRLRARGHTVELAALDAAAAPTSPAAPPSARLADADAVHAWLCATADAAPLDAVVLLHALDRPPATAELHTAAVAACTTALAAVRALTRPGARPAPLWLVTRDAVATASTDAASGLAAAPLWGLGRVIALEHPHAWGGLVDLDDQGPEAAADHLLDALQRPDGEDHIAFRGGERRHARLLPAPELAAAPSAAPIRGDATYLITGGLGNLGLQLADWLVDQGARHLVLTTRQPLSDDPADPRRRALAGLAARGAEVRALRSDAADPVAVDALLAALAGAGPPLRGVFHLAGVSGAHLRLQAIDAWALHAVFAAKVRGAWALHARLQDPALEHFVLFSSAGGTWGAEGQAHYDAACQFMDLLAHHRAARGLVATSVGWGLMAGGGMVDAAHEDRLTRGGLGVMPASAAFAAMAAVAATPGALIAAVDWPRFRATYELRGRRSLLAGLPDASGPAEAAAPLAGGPPPRPALALHGLSGPAARMQLERQIGEALAHILGAPAAALRDRGAGFFTLGLDSLGAVELKNRLERALGVPIAAATIFDHPTIDRLSAALAAQILGPSAAAPDNGEPVLDDARLVEELADLERLLGET